MNKRIGTRITELRSKNGVQRKRAREALVSIGKPAVPFLIGLMTDPKDRVRWEACKALGSIKDPTAAMPLVLALGDETSEVRWLAAEGLIALKEEAVGPLLQMLQTHFDVPNFLHGAHHVLRALKDQNLLTQDTLAVLDKLNDLEPNLSSVFSDQKTQDPIWELAKVAGLKNEETNAGG